MKKILLTIALVFLIWNFSHAQQNGIAVGFAYDNYIGENTGSGKLLGVRVTYEQMKDLFGRSASWRGGFQFSSGNYNNTYTAIQNSNYNNLPLIPNQIEVLGVTNYKSLQFEVTQKLYFGNGNFQYGGVYFLFGLGFNLVRHKTIYDYSNYNGQYYSIKNDDQEDESKEYIYQLTANMGAGYEFHLEYFNLFIESDLNAPIFALKVFDPTNFEFDERSRNNFYGLSLGIRFNLQ